MPSVYTPNASNDPATYTLPSDLDDATAESVNVAFRALADKVHHAYNVFAQLALSNTFLDTVKVNPPTVFGAGLEVVGTGTWRLVCMGHTGVTDGSQECEVRLHVTTGGTIYGALTCNAYWTGTVWRQQANTHASTAILFTPNGFEFARMAAGASDWSTWTTAPAAIYTGDVYLEGGVLFSSPKQRTTAVPIMGSRGGSIDAIDGTIVAGGTSPVWINVLLPTSALVSTLQIHHAQASSSTSTFELYARSLNWSSPTTPALTSIGSATSSASAAVKVTSVSLSSHSFNRGNEYLLRWSPGDAGDVFHSARLVNWLDPGPQNY